ncbi:MAG: ABC transporter ATP-binding protein [Candidatus Dormibacteraeota bacterium]|nr:ABC transporter ATP-binding protein [Candidatus Dormibacteraeota bacterium]MBV8445651.1 ABC transporter ATP-binding protein [Candidatus Dormibacteraeota bacterium]
MQRPPVARTLGLTKSFAAREAITGVDLSIPPGVAFGLLGPNGAGKTTLIRCLLGLLRPTSGSVELMGHCMPQENAAALARVGAVVEEPRFYDHLSGRDNLRVVAALLDESAPQRIPSVLERVGLTDRALDRVGSYSLGMKQRLGIARCLLNDPLLLVLDEPMNGLDPAGIQEFRILVRRLVGEGRSVLISSHLLDEIEKTCDVVGIIDRGRLVRQSTLRELRHTSQNQVRVGCDDAAAARKVMQQLSWVSAIGADDSGQLIVTLAADATAASLNRALVSAGVGVSLLQAAEVTLEERFLDLTTRLQSSEVRA